MWKIDDVEFLARMIAPEVCPFCFLDLAISEGDDVEDLEVDLEQLISELL